MALALPFFAVTLFISAFLLFLVQPIIGKMILPKLGGTPQVWNTCMVFFQTALLAGYFYTHTVSTYLKVRGQIMLHCLLLLVPFLILIPYGPFNVIAWIPPSGGNPVFATLALLTIIVGVPFFVVATSAPLLQKWFAYTGHPAARDPYFLYGASNLGSMLSLVLYPVLVEPVFRLQAPVVNDQITFDLMSQSWFWTVGYGVLVVFVVGCALMALKGLPTSGLESVAQHKPVSSTAITTNPVGAEIATMPDPSTNPVVPPADVEAPEPESSTAVAAGPPMPAAASAKPGPSTAIKQGSKQKKKHKHQHRPGEAVKVPDKRESIQTAATYRATAATPALALHAPKTDEVTAGRRLRSILLAAVPSSFMLAVTTHISTDISAIPLFWVIPLAMYLLTFILVFMRWPVVWVGQPHMLALYLQPVALAAVILIEPVTSVHQVKWQATVNVLGFFLTALVCHGELAKDRPGTKHLTEFYLWMSVGGMLGGMFNGLLAPVLFKGVWEFPLAIMVAAFIRPFVNTLVATYTRVSLISAGISDLVLATLLSSEAPKPDQHKGKRQPRPGRQSDFPEPSPSTAYTLDVLVPLAVVALTFILRASLPAVGTGLGLALGIPLGFACLCYARPIRFGLAISGIILVQGYFTIDRRGNTLVTERSYFGVLHVSENYDAYPGEGGRGGVRLYYRNMTHGTTHHGQNFLKPSEKTENPVDYSRLATTYYHRQGPVGIAMAKFDWFDRNAEYYWKVDKGSDKKPGVDRQVFDNKIGPYPSDARMIASLAGFAAAESQAMGAGLNLAQLPLHTLLDTNSEPPYATIGLGTGTMASYARPFQRLHFYEIDDRVRRYSLPESGMPYFDYLHNAQKHGALVDVLMGDARLRMAQPWIPKGQEDKKPWEIDMKERGGPDYYYHLIVVDAFSSDAIPVHLLTKEAVEMYMRKLAPDGVLCIHISNRHLKLDDVCADIADKAEYDLFDENGLPVWVLDDKGKPVLDPKTGKPQQKKQAGLAALHGRDNVSAGALTAFDSRRQFLGHSTSEWVMVARKPLASGNKDPENFLKHLETPPRYLDHMAEMGQGARREPYWGSPTPMGRYVWTDDYSNLLGVLRW